jgi:hypothetical protein
MKKENKTVKQIVEAWLKEHSYTGLYDDDCECGCELSDLMPCDLSGCNCKAGYKCKCDDNCEHEGAGESDWHISANKPKETSNDRE